MPTNAAPLEPWRALRHPLWWTALAILIANDHVLKGSGLLPGAVTGKLSDVAGLVVAPALLATIVGARRWGSLVACHVAPVIALAALKLVPGLAALVVDGAASLGETWAIVADPTDVLAAPAALLAFRVLAPRMRGTGGRPDARALVLAAAGALACAATSRAAPQTPTVDGDVVVVQTWSEGEILQIDARSGATISRVTPAVQAYADAPVVHRGAVWLAAEGRARAIDLATGAERWSGGRGITAVGAVDDHAVYGFVACGPESCDEPRWAAVDRGTRQERWSVRGDRMAPPVLGDGMVAIGDGPRVVVRDAATGGILWSRTLGHDARVAAVSGGVVWVVELGADRALALDARTGADRRRFAAPGADAVGLAWGAVLPSAAAHGDMLLLASDGVVRALDPDAEAPRWTHPGTGVAVGDGKAVIGTTDSALVCLDAATGRPLWRGDELGWTRAAVSGAHLVLRRGDPWIDVHDLATGVLRFRFALEEGTAGDP